MDITATRAMLSAVLSGCLNDVVYREHPIFRLQMPETCPGVDARILDPVRAWDDARAYEKKARQLSGMFHQAFHEIAGDTDPELTAAGPA